MASLLTPNAPFDRYLLGDQSALSEEAREGYELFRNYGCVTCHQGVGVARGSFFEAPEYVRLFLGADPRAFRTGIEALNREVGRASRPR